jgi:4-diphosphocytidyl-2-C-methyl-D-erythritol kinase
VSAPASPPDPASVETFWPAPAKLNLFLHVTGRRPDGYHDLQTLFQLIDLTDRVGVTVRTDGEIVRLGGPPEVPAESDLSVRAARALKAATGTSLGASLSVLKHIPIGGGLGGGSSDAATTLLVLNRMWGCELALPQLNQIGARLGADVPVFLHGSSAWAEGRGDQLTPVTLPPRWYLVIRPGVAVGTAEVFQAPELTRNSPLLTIRGFFESGGHNDCEPVVRARYPEVREALEWLAQSARAQLTGTGSCIFAAFASEAEARDVAARVPDRWTGFVARGLNSSPVHERLCWGVAKW